MKRAGSPELSIRDAILETLLPDVPFDGWTRAGLARACAEAGYGVDMAEAVFPGGLPAVAAHFSDWADRRMLERLAGVDPGALRVRDRIRTAVLERFVVLGPHREAVRLLLARQVLPWRAAEAGKQAWRTADRIWTWAGDTARDYNHYTKRGLLCAVLAATTASWLADDSRGGTETASFLDRRIENVMQWGRALGKMKKAS